MKSPESAIRVLTLVQKSSILQQDDEGSSWQIPCFVTNFADRWLWLEKGDKNGRELSDYLDDIFCYVKTCKKVIGNVHD